MVRTVALTCNNCGASLDVPSTVQFVTCEHCHVRLRVERTGGAAYTEVLDAVARLEKQSSATAGSIRRIELERELEKIDAALAGLTDPGGWGVVFLCGAIASLGLLLIFSSNTEAQAAGILNLLFFGGLTLFFGVSLPANQRAYTEQRARLRRRRAKCLERLRTADPEPGDEQAEDVEDQAPGTDPAQS